MVRPFTIVFGRHGQKIHFELPINILTALIVLVHMMF